MSGPEIEKGERGDDYYEPEICKKPLPRSDIREVEQLERTIERLQGENRMMTEALRLIAIDADNITSVGISAIATDALTSTNVEKR